MRTISFFLISLFSLFAAAMSVDEVPNVHVADRTRYVSDPAGYLSDADRARTDRLLGEIWASTSAEPVVVVIPSTDGVDIDTYATELFTRWGIGKKDKSNGLLVLVAVDDREAVIRTGYGIEGLIPDVLASRIIRNEMAPRFREADYAGGVHAAVEAIGQAVSSDEAREELMSRYANDADAGEDASPFTIYLWICLIVAGAMLAVFIVVWADNRKKPTFERYDSLSKMRLVYVVLTVAGLGIPLVALIPMLLVMHHIRRHKRLCPNCSAKMHLLDEQTDNLYLTPAQDAEENLDSIDYDVWLCDNCGETDIIPYINHQRDYKECPRCGARACSLTSNRVLRQPTTTREGQGVRTYQCHNCKQVSDVAYSIPKIVNPPVVVGGGGRGFGGGGGFSGGSFGGGFTGGGGARGGW